jgi:hypothetical protein
LRHALEKPPVAWLPSRSRKLLPRLRTAVPDEMLELIMLAVGVGLGVGDGDGLGIGVGVAGRNRHDDNEGKRNGSRRRANSVKPKKRRPMKAICP